jgi:putative ABC transport system permease protein
MNTREALSIAVRSLRAHKLRSLLTMVGIVIGVCAVVVLVGLGNGLKSGFDKAFGELATAVIVQKNETPAPGGGKPKDLRDRDVEAVSRLTTVRDVTPQLIGTAVMQHGPGTQFRGRAIGSTTNFLGVNNRELVAGRMFTADEERNRSKVVLITPEVVANLYGGDAQSAVGTDIRIETNTFTVIGALKKDGYYDDIALMPLATARAFLMGGTDDVSMIAAKAVTVQQVPAAVDDITRVLDDRRRISDPNKRDYTVTALQNQLNEINSFLNILSLAVVGIAAISLVVGGIGVANIMLVSVTERTREIGIRKAIGAGSPAILKQFLIESTLLGGIGGLGGALLGTAIVLVAAELIPRFAPDFGTPEVSPVAILVAMGVSLGIGLLAGGYPAARAARMRPIEALRFQ